MKPFIQSVHETNHLANTKQKNIHIHKHQTPVVEELVPSILPLLKEHITKASTCLYRRPFCLIYRHHNDSTSRWTALETYSNVSLRLFDCLSACLSVSPSLPLPLSVSVVSRTVHKPQPLKRKENRSGFEPRSFCMFISLTSYS